MALSSTTRRFEADATLVLVGFHGAGKKTLGIIASVALRRQFVDFQAVFRQELGSPQAYIAANGLAKYRAVESELLEGLLKRCDKGHVIVGLGGIPSDQQRVLLQAFARHHPVVYVRREDSDLRQFVTASQNKFERFLLVGNAFFEACSNFDFFNLTLSDVQHTHGRILPSSLKLKEAERVFVRFLNQIYGRPQRALFSSDPLSSSRTFTLQLPLSWLDSREDFEALDSGADAVTLLVDFDAVGQVGLQGRLARSMALLRMHSRILIIVEPQLPDPSDRRSGDALEMLLRLVPDAMACPIACARDVLEKLNASKGNTTAIATHHQPTPLGPSGNQQSTLCTLLKQAQALGFGAVRLTGRSTSSDDTSACVALRHNLLSHVEIPLSMYNTGLAGRASVCFNPVLSPVVLPDSGSAGVTLPEAQQALTACFMRTSKRFVIIGQATQNSLSPTLHNAAYLACGMPYSYGMFKPDDFSEVEGLLADPSCGGLTISLPHKTAILEYLDEISPDARDINAVNTVVLERRHNADGGDTEVVTRKGYNTDYIGLRNCIQKHLSPANAIREGTTALVIGAGGMARAAIYACYVLGIRRICIYNRTAANAEALAEYYHQLAAKQGQTLRLEILRSASDAWPAGFRLPTIIVSCLPVREVGGSTLVNLRISRDWLQSTTGGVFLEIAYGPRRTALLEQVLAETSTGWVVVDGLSLLVEQGIAQYELFTKRPAPVIRIQLLHIDLGKPTRHNREQLILLVPVPHVPRSPAGRPRFRIDLLEEEAEPAIGLGIDLDAVDHEALRDGRLELGDGARGVGRDVAREPVAAVHDERALVHACFRPRDEVSVVQAAGPGRVDDGVGVED
ncbi:putative pentafunctional AROM polypeptide [Aspergillus mulundensis]|uniref:Uncharacterized protein n=1 Tax=Aspergillus mulundensis TaxID=1810919 RepID=A0A3D8RQV8_9EURO|nr:Uncharacterized protein DSM5745_06318 [Aspergillus mulundensis]RDW76326.1 Uncharacterized protein DSM5745_06318 [Aspergillus mulundensis]